MTTQGGRITILIEKWVLNKSLEAAQIQHLVTTPGAKWNRDVSKASAVPGFYQIYTNIRGSSLVFKQFYKPSHPPNSTKQMFTGYLKLSS